MNNYDVGTEALPAPIITLLLLLDRHVDDMLSAVDMFNPLIPPPTNAPSAAQLVARLPPPPTADGKVNH